MDPRSSVTRALLRGHQRYYWVTVQLSGSSDKETLRCMYEVLCQAPLVQKPQKRVSVSIRLVLLVIPGPRLFFVAMEVSTAYHSIFLIYLTDQ